MYSFSTNVKLRKSPVTILPLPFFEIRSGKDKLREKNFLKKIYTKSK